MDLKEKELIGKIIESGQNIFLYGPSNECIYGRVKQIDPNCEIVSIYDKVTKDTISIFSGSAYNQINPANKPNWLSKLEKKCKNEPDRCHVLFLDEITKANNHPNIQSLLYEIALNRTIYSKWKLPDNAVIVASGIDEDIIDSPLLKRFILFKIGVNTESWLKWASENRIQPSIYSFIAYKNSEMKSKSDDANLLETLKKWKMASDYLNWNKEKNNFGILKTLVGEDMTSEFVQFCNQKVITLGDVINENYTNSDIQALNKAGRYATTMGLSQVDDTNLEKVRSFVTKLGSEFETVFDDLWTHGDEKKLERLAEAKVAKIPKRGI